MRNLKAVDFRDLYIAVNEMMCELGAVGDISTRHEKVGNVMDELYKLDEGVYDIRRVFGVEEHKGEGNHGCT